MALAVGMKVRGGDFNHRGKMEAWKLIHDDPKDFGIPEHFGGCRKEDSRRWREIRKAWPFKMKVVAPWTAGDLGTRVDWRTARVTC